MRFPANFRQRQSPRAWNKSVRYALACRCGSQLTLLNQERQAKAYRTLGAFVHPVIYLNETMVEATKARVAPVSSAMLYGRGVFTTLAIYKGKPFLWPKHWRRLSGHAGQLDVNLDG